MCEYEKDSHLISRLKKGLKTFFSVGRDLRRCLLHALIYLHAFYIYTFLPQVTPTPPELLTKEKTFVLDCNATSSISRDYCKANPKLGPVIPPYNSQRDKHVTNYFRFYGVNTTLRKTGQVCHHHHRRGHGHGHGQLHCPCLVQFNARRGIVGGQS